MSATQSTHRGRRLFLRDATLALAAILLCSCAPKKPRRRISCPHPM